MAQESLLKAMAKNKRNLKKHLDEDHFALRNKLKMGSALI